MKNEAGITSEWAHKKFIGRLAPRHVSSRSRGQDGERGAVLVLALIFLVVVSVVVASLETWATNDLNNATHFQQTRSLQFSARSIVNLAIQNIRYSPEINPGQTLNASPPSYCWGNSKDTLSPASSGPSPVSMPMQVWCSTVWNPANTQATRVVTISACPTSVATSTLCAQSPTLQAVVSFSDYPNSVQVGTQAQCVVYCGESMSVQSWLWSPTLPTVTSLSATSGSVAGGSSLQISGTGLSTTTAVNFIAESAGTPSASNVVYSVSSTLANGGQITSVSPTQVNLTVPAVSTISSYFVTVTTGTGTTPFTTNGPTFTYTPAIPTVSSLVSGTSGPTTGGTQVTISGSGFLTGAVVNFYVDSSGSPSGSAIPAAATTVASPTTIEAISPAVTNPGAYFVVVQTTAGPSATNTSNLFTYTPFQPQVVALTVYSGPMSGGTGLTITGTGFLTGVTSVNMVQDVNGNENTNVTVPVTNLTVTGATTVVITTPAVTQGTTYFVIVTTPGGTSPAGPVFTY